MAAQRVDLGPSHLTPSRGTDLAAAAVIDGLGTRQADDPQARAAITRWLADQERSGDRRSKTPGPLSTRAVAVRASILRRAYHWSIVDTMVLTTIQAPPVPRVNVRYEGGGVVVTPANLDDLRRAVPDHWRPMVGALIGTGMRIGEVCALDVASFDPVGATVVGGSKTTAGRNRVVKLPSWVVADISRMLMRRYDGAVPDPGDPLFVNTRGGRVSPDPFRRRVWQPAAAQAGIAGSIPTRCVIRSPPEPPRLGRRSGT